MAKDPKKYPIKTSVRSTPSAEPPEAKTSHWEQLLLFSMEVEDVAMALAPREEQGEQTERSGRITDSDVPEPKSQA